MNIFLICPVRNATEEQNKFIETVLKQYEENKDFIYWPARDTNQEDKTGYRICSDNLEAIKTADKVAVIWDGKSQGCLFDLGIAFALGKKIEAVSIPSKSKGKSFQNMILEWEAK
jgi:hypothetical protein